MTEKRWLGDEAGFSLIEVIAAAAILTISVAALLSSVTVGYTSVDLGRQQTTAVFLAEQRLQEARAFAQGTGPGQGFPNLVTGSFPNEAYGAIANAPLHRRTVVVTNNPGGVANTKLVQVNVFYRPPTSSGTMEETAVNVSTLVTQR